MRDTAAVTTAVAVRWRSVRNTREDMMLLRLINRLKDAIPKKWSQADDFKRRMQRQLCADLGNAVGDEKRLERPCTRNKFLPALIGEHCVGDEARHGNGARFLHALGAADQRAAGLHLWRRRSGRGAWNMRSGWRWYQVIYKNDMRAWGGPVSEANAIGV